MKSKHSLSVVLSVIIYAYIPRRFVVRVEGKIDRCKKGSNQKVMIKKLRIRILWLLVVAATINRIQQLSNEHLTFGKVEI